MAQSVQMPALGESVTEGTVTRWLKQVGDTVAVDEPLLEVSTDKVDTEIPAPAAGVLQQIVVSEDETVEVGAQLATIGDESGSAGEAAPSGAAASQPEEQQAAEPAPQPEPEPAAPAAAAAPAPSTSETGSGTRVSMPALGESVTEGTVTRWLKQEGDTVAVDEPLLEVSTDKVDTEIPSPVAGTVLSITVSEDQTVEVGAQLAVLGAAERQAQPAAEQPTQQPPAPQPAAAAQSQADASQTSSGDGHGAAPYVTPLVRKLAAEHDLDLNTVQGTGVGGRIRKQDVLAAIEQPAAPAPEQAAPAPRQEASPRTAAPAADTSGLRGSTQKMSRMRRVIAARMVESLQVSAQLTTVVEVDITRIARLRERARRDFEAREGVPLSFLPFFARATVEALKQHPVVNASLDTEAAEVTYHDAEHLGLAVDTERGLLVPVMHHAGDLNLGGLARRIADLAERTRRADITPDEMSGGTFTLSNTGSRGALLDTPIINQPQVGILGTGSVVKRPAVLSDPDGDGDVIAVRSMLYLALSYDHRLVDGADATRFLNTIKQRLEDGAFEAELGL